jgi:hypothetical protein
MIYQDLLGYDIETDWLPFVIEAVQQFWSSKSCSTFRAVSLTLLARSQLTFLDVRNLPG